MRTLFFIFILLLSRMPAYLEGDYSENYHGFGGGTWHFNKDRTFSYHEFNCEGGREGAGIYMIDKDSIHFLFKDATGISPRPKSEIEVIPVNAASTGWLVKMNIKETKNREDLPFVNVIAKDSDGVILQTVVTDLDGNAKVELKDYTGKISLSVLFIGYETAAITLEKTGTYQLKVKMVSNFGPATVKQGEKWDYRVIKREKNKITLQASYKEQGPEGEVYVRNVQFDLVKSR